MRTQRSRRASRAALLALASIAAACDIPIPSSAPIVQQTWVVPGDSVEVGVSQILPVNVSLNGGGTAFIVSVPSPAPFATTLGTLCGQPACQSGASVTAPIPAFTSSGAALSRTVTFSATVAAATVTAGTLNLQVSNTLGFDPLRPNGNAAPYGSIAITITNGATNSTQTIGGATQAMPTGAVTNLAVPIPTGTYAGSFSVSVSLDVPAGGNATMAASNAFSVTASVTGLTVSAATVVVNNEAITTAPSGYDLADVDFQDEVQSGALELNIANPFTASATLTLQIQAPAQQGQPAVNISKPVNIPATATSAVVVSMSQAELRSILGKNGVTMTVNGTASGTGAGNTVPVTPTQRLVFHTNVRLVVNVGG